MIIDYSREREGTPSVRRTYIAFVLDRSGSMEAIRDNTIAAFNKQIDAIKREAIGDTRVSLVTFATDISPIFFNRSLDKLEYLNRISYKPNGWTALYDAVGYTVDRLTKEAEFGEDVAFWVIIVSDGQENYSYDYKNTIGRVIKQKQQTGKWTFTYIGSNHDLSNVAEVLNIPVANMLQWTSNAVGTDRLGDAHVSVYNNYFAGRSRGLTSSSSLYSDTIGNNLTVEETTTGGISNDKVDSTTTDLKK